MPVPFLLCCPPKLFLKLRPPSTSCNVPTILPSRATYLRSCPRCPQIARLLRSKALQLFLNLHRHPYQPFSIAALNTSSREHLPRWSQVPPLMAGRWYVSRSRCCWRAASLFPILP